MGPGARSAYTESRGEYLGFGLEVGARGLAAAGVRGAAQAIPHLGAVQGSFGHHDVSHARGHLDAPAASASRQLGAEAYVLGSDVAFGSTSPSLHTVAHELTHVVQQRGDVSMKATSAHSAELDHEAHADAVADAVVAGRSAEHLLDSGPAGGAMQVQLKPGPRQIDFSEGETEDFAVRPPRRAGGGRGAIDFSGDTDDYAAEPVPDVLRIPPATMAPEVAAHRLADFGLREPVPHYLAAARTADRAEQIAADAEYRSGGIARSGVAKHAPKGKAEPTYRASYANLEKLKQAHKDIRSMNQGRPLPRIGARDLRAADPLTDDNRPAGREVTGDIGVVHQADGLLFKVLPHRIASIAFKLDAASAEKSAVEAEMARLDLEEDAKAKAGEVKQLEKARDKRMRMIKSAFSMSGKILKFGAKWASNPVDAAGEAAEGFGGIIGEWIGTGITTDELERAKKELADVTTELRGLGERVLLSRWEAWSKKVGGHLEELAEAHAALQNAIQGRRDSYAKLGKSTSAATAGALGSGRHLGDHLRQVPLIDEFLRLAAAIPVAHLRIVDNPVEVQGSLRDREYAFWMHDNLPRLADAIENLRGDYQRQRKDAMKLLSVME